MTEVLMKTWKGAKFCNQACVERRPSNAVGKREKMRNAHISEMRSKKLLLQFCYTVIQLLPKVSRNYGGGGRLSFEQEWILEQLTVQIHVQKIQNIKNPDELV
jgi:hypothetical protein